MSTGHAAPKRRSLFNNKHIAAIFILLSQTCNNIPLEQVGWLTPFVIGKVWRKPGSAKVRHLHQNSGCCSPLPVPQYHATHCSPLPVPQHHATHCSPLPVPQHHATRCSPVGSQNSECADSFSSTHSAERSGTKCSLCRRLLTKMTPTHQADDLFDRCAVQISSTGNAVRIIRLKTALISSTGNSVRNIKLKTAQISSTGKAVRIIRLKTAQISSTGNAVRIIRLKTAQISSTGNAVRIIRLKTVQISSTGNAVRIIRLKTVQISSTGNAVTIIRLKNPLSKAKLIEFE